MNQITVKKWIVISNTINVVAFLLFYLAKYKDAYSIFYISLIVFLINLYITSNYFIKTRKVKEKLDDYRKYALKFYFQLFFVLFFLGYGLAILVDYLSL